MTDVKKLIELLSLFENKEEKQKIIHTGEETRIVILQRGWVVVGKYHQNGSECWITEGSVIRSWGTEKGLGQLANYGKTVKTILDPIPLTKFHELTVVASMICNSEFWK